eukprot:986359_1
MGVGPQRRFHRRFPRQQRRRPHMGWRFNAFPVAGSFQEDEVSPPLPPRLFVEAVTGITAVGNSRSDIPLFARRRICSRQLWRRGWESVDADDAIGVETNRH